MTRNAAMVLEVDEVKTLRCDRRDRGFDPLQAPYGPGKLLPLTYLPPLRRVRAAKKPRRAELREWCRGNTSAFQAFIAGSIPVSRSDATGILRSGLQPVQGRH